MKPATQPPGLEISINTDCIPIARSRKAMFGLVSRSRKPSMKVISSGSISALAVFSVRGPASIWTVFPSNASSRSSTLSTMKSIRFTSSASLAVTALASSIIASARARASSPRGFT
jgi:hypothetical protein